MRRLLKLAVFVLIVAGGAVGVSLAWTAIGGGPLGTHGLIALSLGIAGTAALAWGLMALAFRSNREGWDARANQSDAFRDPDKP